MSCLIIFNSNTIELTVQTYCYLLDLICVTRHKFDVEDNNSDADAPFPLQIRQKRVSIFKNASLVKSFHEVTRSGGRKSGTSLIVVYE